MKNEKGLLRIFIILLLTSIPMQPIMAATSIYVDTERLDSWFTQFKRGIHCFIKRKPCNPKDKKAVYQAFGGMMAILAVATAGVILYTQRNKFKNVIQQSRLTPEEKEILMLPLADQKIAKNEKLLEAVENSDLQEVNFWLAHGADPNAEFGHYYQVINKGKYIYHNGHILNTAIKNASVEDEAKRKQRSEIILALFDAGADATKPANMYWEGELLKYPVGYLHTHSEAQTPYKTPAVEKILLKAAEPYHKAKQEAFFKEHPEAWDLIHKKSR